MSEPAISIDNLGITSEGRAVLPPVSFEVARGETALLYGASGSGKTTLLRAIMGFAADASGSISIHGRQLKGRSVWHIRQALLSYVPQEVDLGPGTVLEALMRPFAYRANRHLAWDGSRAGSLMEVLMLRADIMEKRARELSVGEKHRVALTLAIMLQRPVMLLDEITSGLDKRSKIALLDLIASLSGVTVLAASHDDLFRERSERVIELGETGGAI